MVDHPGAHDRRRRRGGPVACVRAGRPRVARRHRSRRPVPAAGGRTDVGHRRADRAARPCPRARRRGGRRPGLPRQGRGRRRPPHPGRAVLDRATAGRGRRPAAAARHPPPGRERAVARGLLPLLRLEGRPLDAATRYQPGATAVLGGDFLDAIALADGTVRAVIGDVCGHGPSEAALGVALRIAWRTATIDDRSPHDVLAAVSRMLALEREADLYATLCDVTISPDLRRLDVHRHGHPPPLLLAARDGRGSRRPTRPRRSASAPTSMPRTRRTSSTTDGRCSS